MSALKRSSLSPVGGMQKNGPASVGALPDRGSTNPEKDTEMNKTEHSIRPATVPALPRRGFLGIMAAAAVPATAVVAEARAFDWNSFFEGATPAELARFHANALSEAMAKMHPELSWRHVIDHDVRFVLVVGDERPASIAGQEV